ncbi:MAG: hypothetical protein ACXWP5_04975 [Bdellovibrionota bacterium]
MIRTLSLLSFLMGLNAFALGPIPNGTYTGTENCNGTAFPSQMIVADRSLDWDGQLDFDSDSYGFFKLKSTSGMKGSGLGHFTENGLHYELILDYPAPDGKSTVPSPGQITLTYKQGTIHSDSSAAGAGGKFVCSGDYSKAP